MLLSILFWACNTIAICHFCRKYFEITLLKKRLFIAVLFTALLLTNIIYMQDPFPYIVYMLLNHTIIIGFVLLFFRADTDRKLLAASILIAVITMLGNFCESILCCVVLFILHTAGGIKEPFLTDWQSHLIVCTKIAVVFPAIYGMSDRFTSIFQGKTRQWYVSAAIPLLALITVIDVANWGITRGIIVNSRGSMGLYYDQLFSYAETIILTALSAFAAGFYLFGMNKIDLQQRKNSQYQAQIAAYKMLDEQYSRAERLRHDMKNHVIALSGLLENKEYEKIGEYLLNMENSGKLENNEEITESKAVDAILYQKRTRAKQNDILWECDVQIPKACCVNEFDLCVLFGNLLDNAVEACKRLPDHKDRFIHIQAATVKHCFLLEIRNSTVTTDTPNPTLARENIRMTWHTHKKNPGEHGIGLLNVHDVVQSYNGIIDIAVENGIFTASVLIPMHDR